MPAGQTAVVRAELTPVPRATPTPNLPLDPREFDQLCRVAVEARRWRDAERVCAALLEIVPGDLLGKRRLEQAQSELSRQLHAAEAAQRRQRLQEINADDLLKKADSLRRATEWDQAAGYCRRVAVVDKTYRNAEGKQLLAECRAALVEKDPRTAWQALVKLKSLRLPAELESQAVELEREIVILPGVGWVDPAIGMHFRYIPAGSFQMGSPPEELGRYDNERQHRVTLTRAFWMGETEVTQGQWRAVTGSNPSRFTACGDDCPVEMVSWFDVVKYANGLSRMAGLAECYRISDGVTFRGPDCEGYRLPTEAE